jgi:hypothetical protein
MLEAIVLPHTIVMQLYVTQLVNLLITRRDKLHFKAFLRTTGSITAVR